MQFDSTVKLTYAPNNLALNTATLSTQSVTVASGTSYIVSFYGTGSVVLSGAAIATISGTGAGNQVYLKIAATTTTLTLTVAGSVTSAVVAAVTYETTPRSQDQVITTSAAYYGPRFDFDPATLAARGLLIEEARTNYCYYSMTPGDSGWVLQTVTRATGVADLMGGTSGATITASAVTGAHILSRNMMGSLTNGTTYTVRAYVKQGTAPYTLFGEVGGVPYVWGTIKWSDLSVSTNGQASATIKAPVSLGNGIYAVDMTYTAGSNYTSYIQTGPYNQTAAALGNAAPSWAAAGTETAIILGFDLQNGAFATSPIPTTTASVTRAADVAQLTGTALTALQGSAYTLGLSAQLLPDVTYGTTPRIVGYSNPYTPFGASSATQLVSYSGASLTATLGSSGVVTSPFQAMFGQSAAGRSLVSNGGTVVTDANTVPIGSLAYIGRDSAGTYANGWFRSIAIYNQRLPDATLKTKSVVGAAY